MFFAVGDSGPALERVARAKAGLARCPVIAQCLAFALVAIPEGVAGGLTAQDRAQRRQESRPPTASTTGLRVRGVDREIVAELMAGRHGPGASLLEVAHAAIELYLAGHRAGWIATRLGVGERRVHRWVARHRAGTPLTPVSRRSGRVSP